MLNLPRWACVGLNSACSELDRPGGILSRNWSKECRSVGSSSLALPGQDMEEELDALVARVYAAKDGKDAVLAEVVEAERQVGAPDLAGILASHSHVSFGTFRPCTRISREE